ncbi:nuclear transport factor 2 family protein [Sphingosinicella sp. LHD-64]|uniref:nuclear transport factor 2 family protein n=1 Tax=Sphingosinicella sp. LHD-64 TaxID=3072139 RepID=UPI00280DA3DD|nr:nuclear transport factor 2 family protein [Sphingosinicella sp. LHD-64]MDQ8757958.1 nuclear transport factor 2 family protein [Sphingosinicella sp. LHD-64]
MHEEDEASGLTRRSLLAMAPALAVAMTGTAAAATGSGAAMPADLALAWDALNRATVRNDTATIRDLVTEDYMLVNSDTSMQDKNSYLADFEVPGFRVDPYEIDQPMHRVWADAALTGGLFNLSWVQDGSARQSRRLRIAHVWTKQDGRWRLAYTQLTRVPSAAD